MHADIIVMNPRWAYAAKLMTMSDVALAQEAERRIWASGFAANDPRSEYHWQADACRDEAARRGKPALYKQAWEKASAL